MILPELLPVLAIHLYALGTAAVVAGILARNEWLKRAALVLTVLAFTTHTLLLIATFMDDGFTCMSSFWLGALPSAGLSRGSGGAMRHCS